MSQPPPRGSTAARVAKNTAWLSAARIGAKLIGLPLVIVLARFLGPEEFGQWAFILSLVVILSTLADGGFQTLTVRDLAPSPGKARPYYLKSLSARLVLSILASAGLIAWGLIFGGGQTPWWLYLFGAALLFPDAITRAGQAVLTARERMDLTSGLSLIQAAGTTLLVGGVILLGCGLKGSLISLLAINLAAAGLITLVLRPYLLNQEPEPRSAGRLFIHAFPYGLLALLNILYFRVDVIMLTGLRGAVAAGEYSAALRLFEAGLILPAALGGALFPVMARQLATGEMNGLLVSYKQAVRLLVIVGLPAAVAATFYSVWVMGLFFGPAYAGSGGILMLLGWSWILFFINAPLGNLLAASNLMPKFVPFAAANTGLNIGLNFWLIPAYGAMGAAAATLACEVLGLVIQLFFVRRILTFWPPLGSLVARPALAGAGAFAFWLIPGVRFWNPILSLAAGVVVYLIIVIAVKGATIEDWRLLRRSAALWRGTEAT